LLDVQATGADTPAACVALSAATDAIACERKVFAKRMIAYPKKLIQHQFPAGLLSWIFGCQTLPNPRQAEFRKGLHQ